MITIILIDLFLEVFYFMQMKTKNYILNLLEELEIMLNDVDAELKDMVKIRRKLQAFFKKVK